MRSHTSNIKRFFDVIVVLILLLVLSPIWILALVGIFLEHILRLRPLDPLFYTETRTSNGKLFTLIKFNIFRQRIIDNLEKNNIPIRTKKLENNGGLLWVGWLLKQVYMDELPQLVNVLKNDMSLVGPRPLNDYALARARQEGFVGVEHMKAGVTGYFQSRINSHERSQSKLDREYYDYLHSQPWYKIVFFDMRILSKTALVVVRAKGI